jgi:hypothetical protein
LLYWYKSTKTDATISSEIRAVMQKVKKVDKEEPAPALTSITATHSAPRQNSFANDPVSGKVVATSLSKSTLKAMKEAQQAG